VTKFDSRYEEFDLIEVDDALARDAGRLAAAHRLRGYDAVHLAAADRVSDPDLVVVAGDEALLTTAAAEGMTIAAVGRRCAARYGASICASRCRSLSDDAVRGHNSGAQSRDALSRLMSPSGHTAARTL
jgi:hypothetical protein